jgi:hypothetical protein
MGVGYAAVSFGVVDLSKFTGETPQEQEAVATVNGEVIEKRLLDIRFEQVKKNYEAQGVVFEENNLAELREQTLSGMIDERLLVQYGKGQGIEAPTEIVEAQYQEILSQFASEEEFGEEAALQGLTLQDVRDSIAEQIIVQGIVNQQIVENNIEVSDQEIQSSYDEVAATRDDLPSFQEVKDQIEKQLVNQKVAQFMEEVVTRLRAEGTVEIL